VRNKKRTAHAIAQAKRLRQRQQRWAKLARLWGKPWAERTLKEQKATGFGICYSIRELRLPAAMKHALRDNFMMRDHAVEKYPYLGPNRDDFDFDPEWDFIRATLCAFFAAMGRRDRALYFGGVNA
jgi:hypothetical protein